MHQFETQELTSLSACLLRCRQGQARAPIYRHPHTHSPNGGSRSLLLERLPDRPLNLLLPPQTICTAKTPPARLRMSLLPCFSVGLRCARGGGGGLRVITPHTTALAVFGLPARRLRPSKMTLLGLYSYA
jgi:hypothetical protein